MVRLDPPAGVDSLQRRQPMGTPAPEDRGVLEALAAVLGALRQGKGLGRALAAYDRPRFDQAAAGRARDRADRRHDPGLWQRLPPWARRLARDPRRPGERDLR